jgi:hypothetical protein
MAGVKAEEIARSVLKDCVGLQWDEHTGSITITPHSFVLCIQAAIARNALPAPEKMFPIQRYGGKKIPWSVAEKAYEVYSDRYGNGQSLQRLAERGGFGTCEMDILYPEWRNEVEEIPLLKKRIAELEASLRAE